MATIRHWWATSDSSGEEAADLPEPIPFPAKRARMMLRPWHSEAIGAENHDAATNADATLAALEHTSRRIDVLARELHCLWFYADENHHNDDDDDSPSAA